MMTPKANFPMDGTVDMASVTVSHPLVLGNHSSRPTVSTRAQALSRLPARTTDNAGAPEETAKVGNGLPVAASNARLPETLGVGGLSVREDHGAANHKDTPIEKAVARRNRPPVDGTSFDGMTLGAAIRRRRRELGLTLQELAQAAGCAKSYLSTLENDLRQSPSDEILTKLEQALEMPGVLATLASWQRTPQPIRAELAQLQQAERSRRNLLEELKGLLAGEGGIGKLDSAFRSGRLHELFGEPEAAGGTVGGGNGVAGVAGVVGGAVIQRLGQKVPLINSVAAGYPREFTDLGYPARVADRYVHCPDLSDPDAFAARVVGDSMAPDYREGDVVVFSPAKALKDGQDCFARLEPDHESTFKRVYYEKGAGGESLIRLQPINSAYAARIVPREQVAGLYAAVWHMRVCD